MNLTEIVLDIQRNDEPGVQGIQYVGYKPYILRGKPLTLFGKLLIHRIEVPDWKDYDPLDCFLYGRRVYVPHKRSL